MNLFSCDDKGMIDVKFICIGKKDILQKRSGAEGVFCPDQEELASVYDMGNRIEAGVAPICDIEDRSRKRVSINHFA